MPRSSNIAPAVPGWLRLAMQEMSEKNPYFLFDIIPRVSPITQTHEWRLRCLDCPGKLYKVGPGETLDNFHIHSRNRNHRKRVNTRLIETIKDKRYHSRL
ncbi:hypothetical protein QCA50_013157 [Cerrena zonata]|uniref:Uncharacterized protein n=1 Tax=Cerrena zonata TaxID=2478898 RepID=A0AAW0FSL6_9APHY